ncbi:type II toxin-antitoxin system antitoxin SocA domain-containing protein [uncultured Ruegeria sp.]|uniref:Panacea domain-containing protein n=1 Tax=uncultured Ruegeria sp. TaxID=259304 RepID=UPI0026042B0F|nr:type II toxin-antitoxin system antitoxin SocA domain-containing protein [uncultured Ruegeria sp.]
MSHLENAKSVARWFVNRADRSAGEAITQLKVQKLVYYTEAWHLAYFDRPLLAEDFQAWAHGPVVRALYLKYRNFSWDGLPVEKGAMPSEATQELLEAIYESYGQYSAKKLEEMTHSERPWLEARNGLPPEAKSDTVISKLTMRNFYASRINKAEIQALQN